MAKLTSWLQGVRQRLAKNEGYHHTSQGACDALCLERGCCVSDRRYACQIIEAAQATISAASALQESAHHTDCQMELKGKYRCDQRCNWNKFMKALTTWHRVVEAKDE